MRWLIFATLLLTSPAQAEKQCPRQNYADIETQPDFDCPGPGEEEMLPRFELRSSVALDPQQPAPWAGILMEENRVIKLGLRIKALRRLRWEEMRYCAEMASAQLTYNEQTYQAELDLLTSQRDNYKEQAKTLRKSVESANSWYRSPILWFSVGVVVTAAGTVAVVYATR